mmetsp:Transcript_1486/g.4937  ORF Transcript_1486/g.4937 Transcript_1486/m.4937 type:complete len:87 (-) Transcript_1486:5532-5792(-)
MRRNLSRQAQKRLMNELDGWFEGSPVPGMKVLSAESLDEWLVELVGAENTVYADERYFLKFRFPEDVRQTVDTSFARHPGGCPHGN